MKEFVAFDSPVGVNIISGNVQGFGNWVDELVKTTGNQKHRHGFGLQQFNERLTRQRQEMV